MLAALAVAMPQSAHAQAASTSDETAGAGLVSTTTGVGTTGIGLSGVGIYVISSKGDDKRSAAAMHYLRRNALQVRQDLCLGRGPIVEEIAVELRLGRTQGLGLGTQLRKQRHDLLALADPKRLTPDRAWQFFDAVRRIARPSLKAG